MIEDYSSDFITIRRAIYQNFIAKNAPIKEEDLTLHDVYMIIYDVGREFADRNIAGLTEIPKEKSDEITTDIIAYFLSRDVKRQRCRQFELRDIASFIIGMAETGNDDWKSIIDEITEVS